MNSFFFTILTYDLQIILEDIIYIYLETIWNEYHFESFFLLVKIYNCSIKCNICVIFKIHFNA